MYTGTVIADLVASVKRAEDAALAAGPRDSALIRQELDRQDEDLRDLNRQDLDRTAFETRPQPAPNKTQVLKAEQLPQPLGLRPADWNLALLLIVHAQLVRALEPRHNLPDPVHIHQIGAMRPPEQSLIQAGE